MPMPNKAYYDLNKEKCREISSRSYYNRPETSLAYRENNRLKLNQACAKHWANLPPAKKLLKFARTRAKEKDLEFNLTVEDIIVPEFCPILKIPLSFTNKKVGPDSPSLDRIDTSLGYIRGNVQVVSHKANTMKSSATEQELKDFAQWVRLTFPV